jgi:hypothetical protein
MVQMRLPHLLGAAPRRRNERSWDGAPSQTLRRIGAFSLLPGVDKPVDIVPNCFGHPL